MPMHAFMDVLCDGDYTAMYVGEVPDERDEDAERAAFETIYQQYVERMNGGEMGQYELRRRQVMLQSKAHILTACMALCSSRAMSAKTKAALRSLQVIVSGDAEKDCARIDAAFKKTIRELEAVSREIAAESEDDDGAMRGRERFMRLMAAMSSHFKFAVTIGSTVGEFCALYRQMQDEIKQSKRQLNQTRTNGYGRKNQ